MFTLRNSTQHQILNRIWISESFTRQSLSQELSVNRSTVSRSIEGMIEQNLIVRDGIQNPGETGGRKTEILKLNERRVFVLGITLVNDRIFSVISDFKGTVLKEQSISKKIDVSTIVDEIDETIGEYGSFFDSLMAIAISIPGIIDSEEGIVKYSFDLKIYNLHLREHIEEKWGFYTFVENDANAGAACYLLKSKMEDSNLIYFMFSFPTEFITYGGIGAGIVINNKIYKGSRMSAGEVVLDNSWKASKKFFFHAGDLSGFQYESEDFPKIFREMVSNLASRIVTVTTLLDPDRIILGGDINDFSESVLSVLKKEIMTGLGQSKGDYSQRAEPEFIIIDTEGLRNIAVGGCLSFLNLFFSDYSKALDVLNHGNRGD